ncbi:MAG: hypothetical protein ING62_00710, partial [Rhodocyclaceae bacterium]|nr:hypothetical protein [Rhodocyclaceae bacterium]
MTIKILATIAVELAWLGYCRPGFERDLGIELQERLGGEIVDLQEDCGFVRVSCATTQ